MSKVEVLCPNGHRVYVKTSPNTKLLQVNECYIFREFLLGLRVVIDSLQINQYFRVHLVLP